MSELQGEHGHLTELYSTACIEAQRAVAAKQLSENNLRDVSVQLKEQRNQISDLEAELAAQQRAHDLDLELTTITLSSLRDQLASSNSSLVSVFIVDIARGRCHSGWGTVQIVEVVSYVLVLSL